jgi:hypothetical protein
MTITELNELRSLAQEHNRITLEPLGVTLLRPVRMIERLIRSGSLASTIEMELTHEHERERRFREMIEDQDDLLEKLQSQHSDEITICLGIAGPYRVRLDAEPQRSELELSFTDWVTLVGIDRVPDVIAKIKAISGDTTSEHLRTIRDDAAKGKIIDRIGDAGVLGKIYGVLPSTILLGTDLEWELNRMATDEMQSRQEQNQN